MKKEKTTYTNNLKPQQVLTQKVLNDAIESIKNQKPAENFSQIQCGSIDRLCEKLGVKRVKSEQPMALIFWGFPVLEDTDLPENEARLVAKDGFYQRFIF